MKNENTAEKKEYGNLRIVSLDGSQIYRRADGRCTVVCVKEDAKEGLSAKEETAEIRNVIWDGEALLDVSVFEGNGYGARL